MTRCGHSSVCSCRHAEKGLGTRTTGTGSQTNSFVTNVYGAEIAGPGVGWVNDRFIVRIGTGLAYGPSGEIVATGGGGDRPPAGVTVQSLIDRGGDVVGGTGGAGYLAAPQSTRQAADWAADRGVDVVHVLVRPLADGTPACSYTENLGGMSHAPRYSIGDYLEDLSPGAWATMFTNPGAWPSDVWGSNQDEPVNDAPVWGWFGWAVPNEQGLCTLGDVYERVERRCVVLVDLRLPQRDGADTDTSVIQRCLDKTLGTIQRYQTMQSTIVTTDRVEVQAGTETFEPLTYFQGYGLPVGPRIDTADDATAMPPDDPRFGSTWSWAFVSIERGVSTISGYVDAGIHTMIYTVTRHYERAVYELPSGALGVLSADPEYYAGATNHPVLGQYAYRATRHSNNYRVAATETGMLPYDEKPLNSAYCRARGSRRLQAGDQWTYYGGPPVPSSMGDQPMNARPGTPYMVLRGRYCPLPTGTGAAWGLYCGISNGEANQPSQAAGRYLAIGFCIPVDYPFDAWETRVPEDPDRHGYLLTVSMDDQQLGDRVITLWAIVDGPDGAPTSIATSRVSSTADPRQPHHMRLGVNERGIRVQHRPQGTSSWTDAFSLTTADATRSRGGYLYVGRCINSADERGVQGDPRDDYTARFGFPVVYRDDPSFGPPAQ